MKQFRNLAMIARLGVLALAPEEIPARGLDGEALLRYRAVLASGPYFETAAAESDGLPESFEQARRANIRIPQGIPFTVISRGKGDPLPGISEADNRRYEAEWAAMQAGMKLLSPRGRQIIAHQSGHYIHLTESDLVVREILDAARGARR